MTKPKIKEGVAFELKPGKTYLLIFDKRSASELHVRMLGEALDEQGIKGLSVVIEGGADSVKLVEAESQEKGQ